METAAVSPKVTENQETNVKKILAFDRKLNVVRGRGFRTSVKNHTKAMLEEVKKLNDPELLALMTGTLASFQV